MPAPPDTGQSKDNSNCPAENQRVLRPRLKNNRVASPAPVSTDESQKKSPMPSGENLLTNDSGSPKPKSTKSPSALHNIIAMVEQIITKYNPPGQVKTALSEVIQTAKKATLEEAKPAEIHVPLNSVKILHERFKADLVTVHNSLEAKIADIYHNQKRLLTSTETLSKSTEELHSSTKELENKVVKVNDATTQIANTTLSYRDALMAKPTNLLRSTADPKVLDDRDRRARQLMIGYDSVEENATLNISLSDLKDKANKIVSEMVGPTRPEEVSIESVTRTRGGSLLLLLNTKDAADWLRSPDVEDSFLDSFAIGACIKGRDYNVLLRWVPIIFGPDNRLQHREIEEGNDLPAHSVQKARWIKPVNRRRPGQTRAHLVLTLASAEIANQIIKSSMDICGVKVRGEKTRQEPLQCLKCRGWEHKAQDCQAQTETCGTCGEDHRTNNCQNKNKLYCASCRTNEHASWDRSCPEFLRRCANYDLRHPENDMVYFPTEQDWTLTSRPHRIPQEERFPQRFAVNSLPSTKQKNSKPVVRLPRSQTSARSNPSRAQAQRNPSQQHEGRSNVLDKYQNRTGPNLIPLGRGREEGELSDLADYTSCLDFSATTLERESSIWADEPYPTYDSIVGCRNQPTGW